MAPQSRSKHKLRGSNGTSNTRRKGAQVLAARDNSDPIKMSSRKSPRHEQPSHHSSPVDPMWESGMRRKNDPQALCDICKEPIVPEHQLCVRNWHLLEEKQRLERRYYHGKMSCLSLLVGVDRATFKQHNWEDDPDIKLISDEMKRDDKETMNALILSEEEAAVNRDEAAKVRTVVRQMRSEMEQTESKLQTAEVELKLTQENLSKSDAALMDANETLLSKNQTVDRLNAQVGQLKDKVQQSDQRAHQSEQQVQQFEQQRASKVQLLQSAQEELKKSQLEAEKKSFLGSRKEATPCSPQRLLKDDSKKQDKQNEERTWAVHQPGVKGSVDTTPQVTLGVAAKWPPYPGIAHLIPVAPGQQLNIPNLNVFPVTVTVAVPPSGDRKRKVEPWLQQEPLSQENQEKIEGLLDGWLQQLDGWLQQKRQKRPNQREYEKMKRKKETIKELRDGGSPESLGKNLTARELRDICEIIGDGKPSDKEERAEIVRRHLPLVRPAQTA